jgi:hypothetical protein
MNMPSRLGKATLYLFLAYWIVTLLGILLTVVFWLWLNPPSPQELGVSASQAPAYLMTIPFHPLLNLLVWPFFAYRYLSTIPLDQRKREAWQLGAFWVVITVVVDLIGWVLVPHPWAMTFKQMYVDYQPWITFIYLVILGTPVLTLLVIKPQGKVKTRKKDNSHES